MYELLFFDTFSHEVSDKVQLDLVQFPRPVQVTEVRVIPLGARVQADFPGGVRLGATNPSQFEIEFFVNDLSKRGVGTFESVGCLQYNQHGKIHMDFEKKVPTDGMLLRGNFNTITLAVYGVLTKVQREPSPPKAAKREVVPQPPPEKVNTHDRIRDWLEDTQECRKQQPFSHDPSEENQPEWDAKPPRSPIEFEEVKQWEEERPEQNRDFEREGGREREREREREQRNFRGENRERGDRERRRSVERSWSRERSWERTRREGRRDSTREGERGDREQHREREKEFERDRDYEREREREKERDRDTREKERERDKEREREKERERDKEKERERDREKEREREKERTRDKDRDSQRRQSREGREPFEEERSTVQDQAAARTRRSTEGEWDERRSERSDKSSRRPRTPVDPSQLTPTAPPNPSPFPVENIGGEGGNPRLPEFQRGQPDRNPRGPEFQTPQNDRGILRGVEYPGGPPDRGTRGPELLGQPDRGPRFAEYQAGQTDRNISRGPEFQGAPIEGPSKGPSEFQGGHEREAEVPKQVLIPLSLPAEDMEAISDDEDLPDLPPQTPDATEEEYVADECMDDMPMDDPHQDEGDDMGEGFGYEEIMSDEEELPEYQYEEEWVIDEWEDWLKPYSLPPPPLIQFSQLQYLPAPTLTPLHVEYNRWRMRLEEDKGKSLEDCPSEAEKLETLVSETAIPPVDSHGKVRESEIGEAKGEDEEGEKWVQAVETICQLIPKGLPYLVAKKGYSVVETLCEWVKAGLDFNRALTQEQPVYKIRHMKAGVRLTQMLLQCWCQVTHLILSCSVLHRLHSLYHQPHMALSMKLLILKTIDSITKTPLGLKFFLGGPLELEKTVSKGFYPVVKTEPKESETVESEVEQPVEGVQSIGQKNGYELLLELMATVPQTRAKVALSATLRKVHLLDVCLKLGEDVQTLVKHLPPLEEEVKVKEEPPSLDDTGNSMEIDHNSMETEVRVEVPANWGNSVPSTVVQSINSCLREVTRVFQFADQLLAHPHRWLPGSKQFQLPKNPHDPYPQLYLILERGDLLGSLATLLGAGGMVQGGVLVEAAKALLESFMEEAHGINYLATHPQHTAIIIRSLIQLGEDSSDEGGEDTALHLGTQMVYLFQALQHLDGLALLAASQNTDYSQACSLFNTLSGLMMSEMGRNSITFLLSLGHNLEILLPYLRLGPGDDQDNAPNRLGCFGYSVDLIAMVVKFSDNVEVLEKFAPRILEIVEYEETREGTKGDEHVRLAELVPWISIARPAESFTYHNLANLSNSLKEQLEKIDKFSGELVTHLRIIQYLTVPRRPVSDLSPHDHNGELIEELKYKYATVQLFSADCHTHLCNLLTRLCAMYSQPAVHASSLTCSEGAVLLAVLRPALIVLNNILTYVIQARNTGFKDLSAVGPLVETYMLLHAFPPGTQHHPKAQQLQRLVISILLVYTQPHSDTEADDDLGKSLWTKMIAEVLKHLILGPHNFLGVTTLLIELLPVPLPLQTRIALSSEEEAQVLALRQAWSAHLYLLAPNLHEIILRLGITSCPQLMHLLRRLCVSLADLSAAMALMVARAALDLILQAHKLDQRACGEDFGPCSLQTARVLGMLATLVSHAPTKAAVLHLLRGHTATSTPTTPRVEEKYFGLVPLWCRILNVAASGSQGHMQAQDCLVSIIQYLCDHENAMHVYQDPGAPESTIAGPSSSTSSLSGVPNKDVLIPMVDALVDHLRNLHTPHQSLQQVLRALIHLTEHDYGFYHIKSVMEKKKACLISLFKRLCSGFRKELTEHLTSLQGALELCQLLINTEEPMNRVLVVSPAELASYLGWKPGGFEMQFSKYSQDKKDLGKKDERKEVGRKDDKEKKDVIVKKEQDKEKDAGKKDEEKKDDKDDTKEEDKEENGAATEETQEDGNIEIKEEVTEMETDIEIKQEKMEEGEIREGYVPNVSVVKKEIKREEQRKEEPKREEEVQEKIHPLKLLENLVIAEGCEEEVMEGLYDDISQLISVLDQACTSEVKEMTEPNGPEVESLQSLFSSRVVWTTPVADEDIPSYWLVPPVYDEADPSEMVPQNLLETCRQYAGDYDLMGSLHKLMKGQGTQALTPQKLGKGPPRYKHSAGAIRPDKRGRPFVAPMRGRSFNRGMNIRVDPFRSRPPNTSRPPSLHVDDFVALESTGHQPTGPTGYNKISFGRGKFLLDSMRGRGSRGRGEGRGTRFFHRPPFRPEPGSARGISPRGRGGAPWPFRGDGSPRGYRGAPMNTGNMRFSRGRGPYTRGEYGRRRGRSSV